MRIALVAFGTRGDVQPLIALGTRLRAEGHQVVIGASEVFGGWVRDHDLEFHTVGQDITALLRRHGDALIHRPVHALGPVVKMLRAEIEVSFEQTYRTARGADVLFSGLHVAAPSVAAALEIPHRTLLYCPQMLRSSHHPPPGIPRFSSSRLLNEMLWGMLAHGLDIELGEAINRHRRRYRLEPITSVLDYLGAGPAIVASDAALGELPPDAPRGTVQVGSISLAREAALDPALERFLERGEPPVYVGFGSMPDRESRATTQTIVEALATCGRRGVIESGWSGLGAGGVPPGVCVTRSAPHAALLPRVALAVHHGGSGTTAAAARAGIPQIVVPHAADQFYWGEQVYRLGLGSRPLPRGALGAARLARALREVLADAAIAERAAVVGERIARTDGAAATLRLLHDLLRNAPERRRAA